MILILMIKVHLRLWFQFWYSNTTALLFIGFLLDLIFNVLLLFSTAIHTLLLKTSVCRFKSLSYYCHLAASPSFGRADSWGVAFRRRQLSALQTMEMPLDGAKYGWLLNLQTLKHPKYFACLLFVNIHTLKNANITPYIKKKKKHFATP